MKRLKALEDLSKSYLELHKETGGTSGFDFTINWISREKLRAFNQLHGKCWLIRLSRITDEEKCEPYLIQYNGQKDLNGYGLAVKEFDQNLASLLEKWENISAIGCSPDSIMDQVNEIFNRAEKIGCIYLQWV